MRTVMTGPFGMVGYWSTAKPASVFTPVLAPDGTFRHEEQCGFARLSSFATNWNHEPTSRRWLTVVSRT